MSDEVSLGHIGQCSRRPLLRQQTAVYCISIASYTGGAKKRKGAKKAKRERENSENESREVIQVLQKDGATPYIPNPNHNLCDYRSLSRTSANYMASRGPSATPEKFHCLSFLFAPFRLLVWPRCTAVRMCLLGRLF